MLFPGPCILDNPYDAILIVGFGGPEGPDDVMPFLENVVRGRNVPRERMLEVAAHYDHFGGVSPINAQMRQLIAALRAEFAAHAINLPIYWGNRNWRPLLSETLQSMVATGIKRALAYVPSANSSYSSCRQYLENIRDAQAPFGPQAPQIDKLRAFFNHPLFVTANAERLQQALGQLPAERLPQAHVVYTAHSIPRSMARICRYEEQLRETCRLTSEALGLGRDRWQLVYQSRSGRPHDPWLEPDVLDHLRALADERTCPVPGAGLGRAHAVRDVVVMPIGFLSDHMEVIYDLDYEARKVAEELGLNLVRAATVGTHPLFVRMIRELIEERLSGQPDRAAIGGHPAAPDECPPDCCPSPARPAPHPQDAPST